MFPAHKMSKFGKKISKTSSKFLSSELNQEQKDEFKDVDIVLNDGSMAVLNFL